MELKGKVAIVTGAGGSIGSALCKRLDAEGMTLVLIDKNQSILDEVARSLHGTQHRLLVADLTSETQISNLSVMVYSELHLPGLDFLFNIAGIGIYKKLKTLGVNEWRSSIALNLNAPFYLTSALLPLFSTSAITPMIFNIGSGMGVKPMKMRVAYCASKFGLRGMSLAMAEELKGKVDVCLLTLGSVLDEFGTGGLKYRLKLQKKGKKYLSIDQVADKIMEITKSERRKSEYTFYPEGY